MVARSSARYEPQQGPVPRRQRRAQARLWLKLGQAQRQTGEPLPRAERRRRLRAAIGAPMDPGATLVRSGLVGLGCELALGWLRDQLETEADALCGGPKGKHNPARTGSRHGYELGSVPLGGQRVPFPRPRVRSLDRRSELPSELWRQAQDDTFLSETVMVQTLAGVAQRRFRITMRAVTPLPPCVDAGSTSKSAISRRFVGETRAWLKQWLARPLDSERYLALFLDGVELGEHRVVAALGVTDQGMKHVLGLWEGATENTEVCRALLEDLVRRGLSVEGGLLVVIDGGKGLAAAVREVLGDRALVHRCQQHKSRNILDKLPQHRRETVKRALRRVWSSTDATRAMQRLRRLIRQLDDWGEHAAAQSLREGCEQTLTCLRLGIDPELRRSLESTNVIESAFSRYEGLAHRVKRWRSGDQALRWVAASLAITQQSFGILPGAEHLPELAAALDRHVCSLSPSGALAATA